MALLHLGQDLAHPGLDDRLRGEVEVDALEALVALEDPPDAVGEPLDQLARHAAASPSPPRTSLEIVSETCRATAATRPLLGAEVVGDQRLVLARTRPRPWPWSGPRSRRA